MENAPTNLPDGAAPPSRPLLWTATRTGRPPIAFLGVLHFGAPDMYPLPDTVEGAYAAADLVAFETDLRQISAPAFAAAIGQRGALPPEDALPRKLTATTWERLQAAAAKLGYSAALISTLAPWYCASTLTSTALRRSGLASALGLDSFLFSRTAADAKETLCLETPEQQLDLLASIQAGSDEALILNMLDELDAMPDFSRRLLALWRQGAAQPLARLIGRSFAGQPDQREQMLQQRNRNWFSQLEHQNRLGRRILVAVGAGHLVGRESLLTHFRRHRFAVVQAR